MNSLNTDTTRSAGTPRYMLALYMIAVCAILLWVRNTVGMSIMVGLPVLAVITLVVIRLPLTANRVRYAVGLGIIAAIAAWGTGGLRNITNVQWAFLQFALVTTSLMAGWGILDKTGLTDRGIGKSRMLSEGLVPALRAFAMGTAIGLPWAGINLLLAQGSHDPWVRAWWQPLVALLPGISEEAWARILLVPLLYVLLRKVTDNKRALLYSQLVMGYWFAALHVSGGLVNMIVGTLILGSLFSLPLTYLCFNVNLEAAMGFHFVVDFVRFLYAYILNTP